MCYYTDHMCIFFPISDYWGEFCKSSIKLPPQKQKVKRSRINESTWFSQRDSRLQQMQLSHDSSCSYMQQGHKPISFASANVFYSFLVQTSAIWNTTLNQVLKVKDKIHFLYQSGKKAFVLPKTRIWITQSRDKDKRHRHKTDSGAFFSAKITKAWKCLIWSKSLILSMLAST